MQTSIRQLVQDIQGEIAKGNLMPQRAAELLVNLSALLGNIAEEITQRDYEYNLVLLQFLDNETKANRAKIKAEVSKEYLAKRRAYNTRDLAIELIRSLKYFLRAQEQEMREAKY
ncbi:MAG: hypothetical protein AAB875_01010 [Patescibacteria group bacterium]